MNLVDGKYRGIEVKGSDLSRYLLPEGQCCNNTSIKMLIEMKNQFQDIQRIFHCDEYVMERIRNESISGEAYYNAVLKVNNNGKRNKIPNSKTYFSELRKLINRYEKNGFIFKEKADLVSAIY